MKSIIKHIVERNHTAVQIILWSLVTIILTAVALSVALQPGDINLVTYTIATTSLLLLVILFGKWAFDASVIYGNYRSYLIKNKLISL